MTKERETRWQGDDSFGAGRGDKLRIRFCESWSATWHNHESRWLEVPRLTRNREPGRDDVRRHTHFSRLACGLRGLAASVARRLIGDPRVMCAIGQAVERLAAAEEEFRTGGIADRPVAGGLVELKQ